MGNFKIQRASSSEHVFLIGRPPLGEYLGFMKIQSLDGVEANERELGDEWRRANDHVQELESIEVGYADNPQIDPILPDLEPLVHELVSDPVFQGSFSVVPADLGVVELDRLVVYQKHINLEYVTQLQATLPPNPTLADLFRFCLLGGYPQAPISAGRVAQNAYIFTSSSTDLRFLDVALLDGNQAPELAPRGRSTGAVMLQVGYGSNLLNAICIENRLVLHNGSHRAYALRDLGILRVPCIIQRASRREELEVIGSAELKQNPDLYLKVPRPSLLKDYFDPQLRKLVMVPKKVRQVKVSFGIEVVDIPVTNSN